MADINRCLFTGKVISDIKQINEKFISFPIAIDNSYKSNGDWINKSAIIECSLTCNDYGRGKDIFKGDRITLDAQLQMDEWTDKSTGQKRNKLKLYVNYYKKLETKNVVVAEKADYSDDFVDKSKDFFADEEDEPSF